MRPSAKRLVVEGSLAGRVACSRAVAAPRRLVRLMVAVPPVWRAAQLVSSVFQTGAPPRVRSGEVTAVQRQRPVEAKPI
jgi:hypothetical protein